MKGAELAPPEKKFVTALGLLPPEGGSDPVAPLMPRKSPALVQQKELFVVDFDKAVPQSAVHQAVYKARADAGAVFHFHSEHVILLTVVGETVRPMHNYSAIFYEGVPVFEGAGQVETPERAAHIAKLLGAAKAILLRGHGAVVVGQTVQIGRASCRERV